MAFSTQILIHLKFTDFVIFDTKLIQNTKKYIVVQHSSVQPTESSGEINSLSVFHLSVLRVLEGQTQEAARDKHMGVYNSKKTH